MTMRYESLPAGKRKRDKATCENDCFTYSVDGGNLIDIEKSMEEYIAYKYFKKVVNDGVC